MVHSDLTCIITFTLVCPSSGYQIQFHVVEKTSIDNLPVIDEKLLEPFSPLSPLLSKKEAQKSTEAKSFWIEFKDGMIPKNILIDESLLNGTLKHGTEYTVVAVPYTLQKVSLHTLRSHVKFTFNAMFSFYFSFAERK